MTQELEATERSLGYSAAITGGGLGLGLLGVAPFAPPTPFMVGLLLAVLQVRVAHAWLSRQLRAQARRHVTELALAEPAAEGAAPVLQVRCDGGLSRTLRLAPSPEGASKPQLAEVLRSGHTFVFLDAARGSSDDPEALDKVRNSECVITNEDVVVEPFPDESQEEANKMVQPLLSLTHEHLKKLGGKDSATPMASLADIERNAYLTGGVILAGGVVVCAGGRYTAAQDV